LRSGSPLRRGGPSRPAGGDDVPHPGHRGRGSPRRHGGPLLEKPPPHRARDSPPPPAGVNLHVAVPSTMPQLPAIRSTMVISNPVAWYRPSNSASVRSLPGRNVSIVRSVHLAMSGTFEGPRTAPMWTTLPPSLIAFRQLRRIVRHCSSFQAWRISVSRYRSPPAGTSVTKLVTHR